METRLLLARQLLEAKRGDEAVKEIQLASRAMSTDFDKYGQFEIAAAWRQGDYEGTIRKAMRILKLGTRLGKPVEKPPVKKLS